MFGNRSFLFRFFAPVFDRESVLCRAFSAWSAFVVYMLLSQKGNYAELAFGQEWSLGGMLLLTAVFFISFSILAALLPRFRTDTWFLLASATVCMFSWLNYEGKKELFLVTLAVILAYVLILCYVMNRNEELLRMIRPGKRTTWIIAIALGGICATVIAVITCLRYKTFSAPNFDFGLFVNMFHNMKETGLPNVTSERDQLLSHFAVHISPIYYLLLPFYIMFPSPMTLQIGQAVVVASGVIPVLLLSRHFQLSGKMQVLAVFLYAFYPAITANCFYDIHENCFLAPLLLWVFYFFEREKYPLMYLAALGVLMVKEDAAVYVMIFAVFVILSRKKYLHGFVLAAASLVYFLTALWLLENYGDGAMVNRFNNLTLNQEDGLFGALKTALVNPGFLLTQLLTTEENNWDKLLYVLQLFLPLAFLPFFTNKPSRWLLMVPALVNLVTYYQYQYNLKFQYSYGITAFLVYAALLNLPDVKPRFRRNVVAVAAVSCICLYTMLASPYLHTYVTRWEEGKDTYIEMEEILDTLPEDASLNVSSMLLAHVADRDVVYEINYHGDKPDVDYVVIDIRSAMNEATQKYHDAYIAQGYTVYEQHEGRILILKSPHV